MKPEALAAKYLEILEQQKMLNKVQEATVHQFK
jgi:hypothetical protein